jgi:ribosomal protein L37AE/L43A
MKEELHPCTNCGAPTNVERGGKAYASSGFWVCKACEDLAGPNDPRVLYGRERRTTARRDPRISRPL